MKHGYILIVKTFVQIFVIILFSTTNYAQVGINTEDPKTTLDINGALAVREGNAIAIGSNFTGVLDLGEIVYSHYRIVDATSDFTIKSFSLPTTVSLADGQLLTLINTTNAAMIIAHTINVVAEADSGIATPLARNVLMSGINSTITFQYNKTLERWVLISYASALIPSVNSVSVTSLTTISSSTYTDIAGTTLEFTATKPSALVSLKASGNGETTNDLSIVFLRVLNVSDNTAIGGTNQNMQSSLFGIKSNFLPITGTLVSYNVSSIQVSNWNASFEKLLTDLVVGKSYTLKVQGRVDAIVGDGQATISPAVKNDQYLSLSVMQ